MGFSMTGKPKIAVIGAGMVGVCCGLYLQREGFEVTIVDRDGPGEAASFGNLGSFGIASCVPAAMPGLLKKVPGMLMDPEAPLKVRWGYAAKALPWFLRFARESRRGNIEANASARQSLLDKVHESIDPLVADAGAKELMHQAGLLFTFESEAAFEGASYAFDLRRRNGVAFDVLDGNEARQVEPALTPKVVRGIRIPNLTHTFDPLRLVQALAGLFVRNGGQLENRVVTGFDIGPDGARAIRTSEGDLPIEKVVLAAGVWSRELAAMLGTKVPLEAERGYHVMFNGTETKVNSAVLSVDRYLAVTPMLEGVRAGGTAEFAGVDAPPRYEIAQSVRRHAEALFPGIKGESMSEWMGPRPSHPDSKPVIDRSPRHGNVYFAFGHDHLGLTMGGITGKLISELATGQTPSVDLEPFRADRF
jgi:D-amino-acid dehydrogenase